MTNSLLGPSMPSSATFDIKDRNIKESHDIIIIGGGTWGVSTALHLARRGYQDVTVLDPYEIPSPISAGNDENKICGRVTIAKDDDASYITQKLSDATFEGWENDPIFKPYFHDTGYVLAASSPEGLHRLDKEKLPDDKSNYVSLKTAADFRSTMPDGVLTGDFPGWKGWWQKEGVGWVEAKKALISAANEAERLGVNFVARSPQGRVENLLFSDDHTDVRGVKTADGLEHYAKSIILCAGATAPQIIDTKNQLRPTAWTLAQIKLSPTEVQLYQNLPVLFNIEKGFFMEPDEELHELKICDEHPGYCNWVADPSAPGGTSSIPFAKHQIPLASEKRIRNFLKETMPHLAERPFVFARICWCADTPDRSYLIGPHPDYPSLTLGIGGSGHGYKHIPSIGGFIVDSMEGHLDQRMQHSFRWRPELAKNPDWVKSTLGRFGGPNKVMDFEDVKEWTDIPPR